MVKHVLQFIFDGSGNLIDKIIPAIKAQSNLTNLIQVVAPIDSSYSVFANYDLGDSTIKKTKQYLRLTNQKGIDVVDSERPYAQTVAQWNVWEMEISSLILSAISKKHAGSILITFDFSDIYYSPECTNLVGTFGIDPATTIETDLPAIEEDLFSITSAYNSYLTGISQYSKIRIYTYDLTIEAFIGGYVEVKNGAEYVGKLPNYFDSELVINWTDDGVIGIVGDPAGLGLYNWYFKAIEPEVGDYYTCNSLLYTSATTGATYTYGEAVRFNGISWVKGSSFNVIVTTPTQKAAVDPSFYGQPIIENDELLAEQILATLSQNSSDINDLEAALTTLEEEASNMYEPLNPNIQEHIAIVDGNPHGVDKTDVGLGSVENYGIASQVEALDGVVKNKYMTPYRTKEAIDAKASGYYNKTEIDTLVSNIPQPTEVFADLDALLADLDSLETEYEIGTSFYLREMTQFDFWYTGVAEDDTEVAWYGYKISPLEAKIDLTGYVEKEAGKELIPTADLQKLQAIEPESDPIFTAWDKSTGVSITESQISDFGSYSTTDHNHDTSYEPADTDIQNHITAVTGNPHNVTAEEIPYDNTTSGLTATDINAAIDEIDNALDQVIAGGMLETDPLFTAWDKSDGISITESQISDLKTYITEETDPVFTAWDKSTGISITESQISDLKTYIETSSIGVADGVASLNESGLIPSTQLPSYVDDVVEIYAYLGDLSQAPMDNIDCEVFFNTTDSILYTYNSRQVEWVVFTGEKGKVYFSTLDNKTYRWSGSSNKLIVIGNDLALGTTSTTAAAGDHNHDTLYEPIDADIQNHITTVTGNPHNVLAEEISYDNATSGLTATDVNDAIDEIDNVLDNLDLDDLQDVTIDTPLDGHVLRYDETSQQFVNAYPTGTETETDPVFTAWDKSTGIIIAENQISDLQNYITTESDPLFTAWDKSTGISITESQISDLQNYLTTETDPVFTAWDKSTGISITESQISDLKTYIQTSSIGALNGVASLDGSGKVPSAQLPSYVDDVVEINQYLGDLAENPVSGTDGDLYFNTVDSILYRYDSIEVDWLVFTGESGKIYFSTLDNQTYRWSGASNKLVTIGTDLALGTTSTTAAAGDHNHDTVYEPADTDIQNHITSVTGNPHQVTVEQIGAAAVNHDHNTVYEPADADIQTHITTVTGNPHNVIAGDIAFDNTNTEMSAITVQDALIDLNNAIDFREETIEISVTIETADWATDGVTSSYKAVKTVSGILANEKPIISFDLTGIDDTDWAAYRIEFSKIGLASTTDDDEITFYASETPTEDIAVIVKLVGSGGGGDGGDEIDPVFATWDKSTGISITESQISDFGTYSTTDHNHDTVYEPADDAIQSHITVASGNPHNVTAGEISYNNINSDISATTVQGAIDEIEISVSECAKVYNYTGLSLSGASWLDTDGDFPYYQTISVLGVVSGDEPFADIVTTGLTKQEIIDMQNAWASIYEIETGTNTITFRSLEPITVDISLKVKVIK